MMLNGQYTKIELSQKELLWIKITDEFWALKIIIFLADIGYLVNLLSNH